MKQTGWDLCPYEAEFMKPNQYQDRPWQIKVLSRPSQAKSEAGRGSWLYRQSEELPQDMMDAWIATSLASSAVLVFVLRNWLVQCYFNLISMYCVGVLMIMLILVNSSLEMLSGMWVVWDCTSNTQCVMIDDVCYVRSLTSVPVVVTVDISDLKNPSCWYGYHLCCWTENDR